MMNDNLIYEVLKIRRIEEAISDQYSKLEMRQPVHLDIGAEWVSVAVCSQLQQTDSVFGGHRSHSQYLACGDSNSLKHLICGLMGKNDLSSMHLHSDGIFKASTSIVGGIIPVAVGAAWAKKLKGESGIVVCFLGDGATEEGVWVESLSFSVLHELPILFVVQNNELAVTTPIEYRHKYDISAVARAYGLGASKIDGGIEILSQMTACVIGEVKKGIPFLLEVDTERQRVHCGVEFEYELKHDVLEGYTTDETEITREIEEAFEFARQSPEPTEVRNIYAD